MKKRKNQNRYKEEGMRLIFLASACASIVAVVLICVFLFAKGLPTMAEIGIWKFLSGTRWKPSQEIFGILPMIVGSIYATAGAVIVGVPIGILCAVFLSHFCPDRLKKLILPAVELLAGIPSIVYGFFGLMVIVPCVQMLTGTSGKGLLTASLLLGIMILPTIITVAKASIDAVPRELYEGSLALGATHEKSVFFTVLPAARSGILAGVVLGVGRAIGETMAVVMVAGNQAIFPTSITGGLRTLTANIVLEMAYAGEFHRNALIATGVVLFVFIMIINLSFAAMKRRAD